MKRVTARPIAQRHQGGWLLPWEALEDVLQQGDVLEFGGIQVGSKTLLKLVRTMRYGNFCHIKANERLELSTNTEKRYRNWFALVPGAWMPKNLAQAKVVVLRPARR